ncbi:MAG: glycosyl transferase family 2 [Dehalococcoidia bacterium]|nr:glycosyl transferase family 2 [Dehalococcoidia bacterium]
MSIVLEQSTSDSRNHDHDNDGKSPKVVVAIPAYNEDRFIGSVVLKAKHYAEQVVVVDDGSTDMTWEVAEAAGATVVRHPINLGKGHALNTAFRVAREMGADCLVVIDGDGQHHPEEIPTVLHHILEGNADMVVGSRYLEVKSSVPWHRIWGHRAVTLLGNLGSGIFLTDSQNGFRAFSRKAVDVMYFQEAGFSVESEMQFLAKEHGLRVREAPTTIRYQDAPKRNVIAHGLWVLDGILRLIGQYRPLLFFGVPGAILIIAGILIGACSQFLPSLLAVFLYSQELSCIL